MLDRRKEENTIRIETDWGYFERLLSRSFFCFEIFETLPE
jgi:hypothetical protein